MNKRKDNSFVANFGALLFGQTLSPIQIFLQLQVQLNTAQYFIRLNVVISLVCETVSCVM